MDKFKAGQYYIGDLCYVIDDELWGDVCDKHFGDEEDFTIRGNRLFMAGTAYGDGSYDVQGADGVCLVDSGTIGCLRVDTMESSLVLKNMSREELFDGGIVVTFDQYFEVSCDGGVFNFGHIVVDTEGNDDEDDDWEDSWQDSYSDEDEDEDEDYTGTNNGDEIL